MKKFFGFVLSAVGLLLTLVLGILAALEFVGTDADLYYRLQQRYGVLDTAGISQEDLKTVDAAMAECLKGDAAALPALSDISIDGEMRAPFHDYEQVHMDDCRHLFDLLRTVKHCLYFAPLLAISGMLLLNDAKRFRRASILALLLILMPLGAFGIWAAADFDAAFTFFHHLLFTNNLWLLNPDTDLLIRICPEEMFMQMGIRIASVFALWVIFVLIAVNALNRWKLSKRDKRG